VTGRGNAYLRGAITGAGTFLGGILHTLPFLIPQYRSALIVAVAVIAFELLTLSWIRARFFATGFLGSFVDVRRRDHRRRQRRARRGSGLSRRARSRLEY
jgi:Zn-dependent protease with chaperone function